MLRYVKIDPTQQTVVEFCCSRVIFFNVNIWVPDMRLLFDTNFIRQTFKKYKRSEKEHTKLLSKNCGKCGGHGFYDWVTRLTSTNEQKPIRNIGKLEPLIVKNEDPISVIYCDSQFHKRVYYYVSDFKPSSVTYRCEQCLGTGLPLYRNDKLTPLTLDDFSKPESLNPAKPNIFRGIYEKIFRNKNNCQAIG